MVTISLVIFSVAYFYTTLRKRPKKLKLGDGIKNGDGLLITFTGTRFTREIRVNLQFVWHAPEGQIFFLVNMTLENIGETHQSYAKSNLPIDPDNYFQNAVLVSDDEKFEIMGCAFSIYKVKAGEVIDTYIFFEIPSDIVPKELRSSPFENKVEWILRLEGLEHEIII